MFSKSLIIAFACVLLSTVIESKHIHRGLTHRHAHLAKIATPTNKDDSVSSTTGAPNDAALRVKAMEASLGTNPQNLLSLIAAMKQNLAHVESILESIVSCTAESTSIQSTSSSMITPVIVSSTPTTPQVSTSNAISYALTPTPSAYTFRPDSKSNVAVYYGTTQATISGGLLALCLNKNVDIVVLSFVGTFFGPSGYPSINFGPGCKAANAAQASQASGLMDCTELAGEIAGCHEIGKKVLVSLGGWGASSAFTSDAQATAFASTLWNLFGAGTETSSIRPFGTSVVVDGFDIDNENHNTAYYTTFATALRQQFALDTSKTYYLSAAPQCPLPDESIPLSAMLLADFVWVQFYNNPSCNLNTAGFQDSFANWAQNLTAGGGDSPRLYIGAPAFSGAGSGYVAGAELSTNIGQAVGLDVSNLGGIMLWDGSEGMANVDDLGNNYLMYAKQAVSS